MYGGKAEIGFFKANLPQVGLPKAKIFEKLGKRCLHSGFRLVAGNCAANTYIWKLNFIKKTKYLLNFIRIKASKTNKNVSYIPQYLVCVKYCISEQQFPFPVLLLLNNFATHDSDWNQSHLNLIVRWLIITFRFLFLDKISYNSMADKKPRATWSEEDWVVLQEIVARTKSKGGTPMTKLLLNKNPKNNILMSE